MKKQAVAAYQEEIPDYFPELLVMVYYLFKQDYEQDACQYKSTGDEHALLCATYSIEFHYYVHYLVKKLFPKEKHKLPSLDRDSGVFMKPTAELYYQLFKIVCYLMSIKGFGYGALYEKNPFLAWALIMREGAFEGRIFYTGQKWGKTISRVLLQKGNRQLSSFKGNPFSESSYPCASLLLELGIHTLETQNPFAEEFRTGYWMPMVRARKSLAQAVIKSRNESWINGATLEVIEFRKPKMPFNHLLKKVD